MQTLAIETSCDETAVAIIKSESVWEHEIVAEALASQIEVHKEYGGVVPGLAARQHTKNMPVVLEKIKDKINVDEVDQVAFTEKPGLEPCLLIGKQAAQTLAFSWEKPVKTVNHLYGHLCSAFLVDKKFEFPALALIVSGGHTQLILWEGPDSYRLLGETVDDAAGEAFDKGASLLNLEYPGGPSIQKASEKGDEGAFDFPRPMSDSDELKFSFSGLKTALLYTIEDMEGLAEGKVADLAASYQEAIVDSLLNKLKLALSRQKNVGSLVVVGGVSANKRLRKKVKDFSEEKELDLVLSPIKYATDNAVMIGVASNVEGLS